MSEQLELVPRPTVSSTDLKTWRAVVMLAEYKHPVPNSSRPFPPKVMDDGQQIVLCAGERGISVDTKGEDPNRWHLVYFVRYGAGFSGKQPTIRVVKYGLLTELLNSCPANLSHARGLVSPNGQEAGRARKDHTANNERGSSQLEQSGLTPRQVRQALVDWHQGSAAQAGGAGYRCRG